MSRRFGWRDDELQPHYVRLQPVSVGIYVSAGINDVQVLAAEGAGKAEDHGDHSEGLNANRTLVT